MKKLKYLKKHTQKGKNHEKGRKLKIKIK